MSAARLIAVDWGTTSLRCYLVGSDGTILARHEAPDGILAVAGGDFAGVLSRALSGLGDHGEGLPIIMSGMIGSRQGWFEAPYVRCPASLADIAARLQVLETPFRNDVYLVPGLDVMTAAPAAPDVMRGEETQILGAAAAHGTTSGLFVLPGTHSKWVRVTDETITSFATYMTGEVFAALKDHTILGRPIVDGGDDPGSFARGVAQSSASGAPGSLLNAVFSARTLYLAGDLPADGIEAYLSGLLIGSEVRAACGQPDDQPLYVMAGSTLAGLYVKAAAIIGVKTIPVDGDCIVRGHLAIAGRAGILAR